MVSSAIRRHWVVESAHQVLDVAFEEDDYPWLTENPRLTVVLMILRRIAYTLLTIFRSVTQRSDERRSEAWKELFWRLYDAVLVATAFSACGDFTRQPEARRTSAKSPRSHRCDQQIRSLHRRPDLGPKTTDQDCSRLSRLATGRRL